ncbi:microfibril-associated glycoprotein 4-like [Babylonia areolata]|uniref:microfibril-associated glycoprotein 4-like n=1 Tax=Babylonia areolata TaxID=304850 RepID=UPI003FD4D5C5
MADNAASIPRLMVFISLVACAVLMHEWPVAATSASVNTTQSSEVAALKAKVEALESSLESMGSTLLQNLQEELNATLKDMASQACVCAGYCCQVDNTTSDAAVTVTTTTEVDRNHTHCQKIRPWTQGVKQIWSQSKAREVYCDGQWTVIQRRMSGQVDFYRDWSDYVNGFGNASDEYWLGLAAVRQITASGRWQLRVDLENWKNQTAKAIYNGFKVLSKSQQYALKLRKFISGSAGDSLFATHLEMKFSTKDRDNDRFGAGSCAQMYRGGWWFNECFLSNLNGVYYYNSSSNSSSNSSNSSSNSGSSSSLMDGVSWKTWMGFGYSLKKTVMKIRPL